MQSFDLAGKRRRTLRRAVNVECDVHSDAWDGAVTLWATDLSQGGMWLCSELPLECGEELLVSLMPPQWLAPTPLYALAEVARVGMHRRRRDLWPSGMGLRFIDIDRPDARRLEASLEGLPPPLPPQALALRLERMAATRVGHAPARDPEDPALLHTSDGDCVRLEAEAPLLTGSLPKPLLVPKTTATPPAVHLPSPKLRAVS